MPGLYIVAELPQTTIDTNWLVVSDTNIAVYTNKIRLIASSDEVCCVLYQTVSTTQYESLQYTKFQLLLWLFMTFDLVPTQSEGVLSKPVGAKEERNGPPSADHGLSTAKHNRYHVLSPWAHCLDQAGINSSIYPYIVTVLTRVQWNPSTDTNTPGTKIWGCLLLWKCRTKRKPSRLGVACLWEFA